MEIATQWLEAIGLAVTLTLATYIFVRGVTITLRGKHHPVRFGNYYQGIALMLSFMFSNRITCPPQRYILCRSFSLPSIAVLALFLFISLPVKANDAIQVYYAERVPYAMTHDDGSVSGLTATPVATALKHANIRFTWKKMPFKRQLASIQANKVAACGIGWFKKPERERFAKFSEVIYQDQPTVTISLASNTLLEKHRSIIDLFSDKRARLLVKDSFSYGGFLDAQIAALQPNTISVTASSNIEMLKMIKADRADYFFTAKEEASTMVTEAGFDASEFKLTSYTDMPAGNKRYLACSERVANESIQAINQKLPSVPRH